MEDIIKRVFDLSKAEETEVHLEISDDSLTRFAHNEINQSVNSKTAAMNIRIKNNGCTASCDISNFSDESIRKSLKTLDIIVKEQIPDDRLQPMPGAVKSTVSVVIPKSIVELDESKRADFVFKACNVLQKKGASGTGICSNKMTNHTHRTSKGYANNFDVWEFAFSLTAKNSDGTTREEYFGTDVSSFNPEKAALQTLEYLNYYSTKINCQEGHYDIILTPYAFAELLQFLFYFSFSGKEYYEKTSFLAYNLGKKIFSEKLTIIDNPLQEGFSKIFYDYEGTMTRKNTLVDKGICSTILASLYHAKILSIKPSGNCFSPTSFDTYPIYPIVMPGKNSFEDLVKSTKKGLLINRLHYINIIDPLSLEVTGMTRDGVFMIENGKITGVTNNLRFTESIIKALSNIEALSDDSKEAKWFAGFMKVPSVKINNFNFTSTTSF